jgi:hypothetical protein
MKNDWKSNLIGALAVLAAIASGHALDVYYCALRLQSSQAFHSTPLIVFLFISPLLRSGLYLTFAWILLLRLPLSRTSYAVYLATGVLTLLMSLAPFVTAHPLIVVLTAWEPIRWLRYRLLLRGFASSLLQMIGFMTIVAAMGLIRGSKRVDRSGDVPSPRSA